MASGVEVRAHPRFGPCAFALRAFRPGEVVISEAPLLITPDPDAEGHPSDLYEECYRLVAQQDGCRGPPGTLHKMVERFLTWCCSTAEVKALLLSSMQTDAAEVGSQEVQLCGWAAGVITEELLPHLPGLLPPGIEPPPGDEATVLRVLLAWAINAHGMGEREMLFDRGSKLPHTCAAANTECQSMGGRGYHVALTHIAAGELLTTCYIGARDLLRSTPARRQLLHQNFAFRCGCERCEAPEDDLRGLPCPACVPRDRAGDLLSGITPPDERGAQQLAGVLTFHSASSGGGGGGGDVEGSSDGDVSTGAGGSGAGVAGGTDTGGAGPYWQCSGCGCRLPNEDTALFPGRLASVRRCLEDTGAVEAAMCYRLWDYDRQLVESGQCDWEVAVGLVGVLGRSLGPEHFALNTALLIHAEVALAELRGILEEVTDLSAGGGGGGSISNRQAMAVAEYLKDVGHYLDEVEDDWRRVWGWLGRRRSLWQPEPGYAVHERLVYDAKALLDVRDRLLDALPGGGGGGQQLATRAEEMAGLLLGWVDPVLERCFRHWQTPEPYSKVEQAEQLRARLVTRPAARRPSSAVPLPVNGGGGGGDGGLQDLMAPLAIGRGGAGGGKRDKGKKGKKGEKGLR